MIKIICFGIMLFCNISILISSIISSIIRQRALEKMSKDMEEL